MNQKIIETYSAILQEELIPALGCTDPIAVASAAAQARALLDATPERVEVWCSGNIVKNVKSVVVPNSDGMKGIDAAAVLGMVGGDGSCGLEVLSSVTGDHIAQATRLLAAGCCTCHLAEGVPNLYVRARVTAGTHSAEVEIREAYTNVTRKLRDGVEVYRGDGSAPTESEGKRGDKSLLNLRDILAYADMVELDAVRPVLERQIALNTAISQEGLSGRYGAAVGSTLLSVYGDDVKVRARAAAAAGSDARMGGCALPVVINSGSGNQGATASLPVIEFARAWEVGEERLIRALVVSNLVAIHQKRFIGSLSAYCGVVSAAAGSGAAITYLSGGDYDAVGRTIVNTIATVGGMVCDGAKPSCAAKIAAAVDAAITAHYMSMDNRTFRPGEGLVGADVEQTIRNLGLMGCEGMRETDLEILRIMMK